MGSQGAAANTVTYTYQGKIEKIYKNNLTYGNIEKIITTFKSSTK